jgi:hypothetical protein
VAKWIGHVRPGVAPSITTPSRGFKVNSRRKIGERQRKLSLRSAELSRMRTLKKQAIARGVLAVTAVVMSNMG